MILDLEMHLKLNHLNIDYIIYIIFVKQKQFVKEEKKLKTALMLQLMLKSKNMEDVVDINLLLNVMV